MGSSMLPRDSARQVNWIEGLNPLVKLAWLVGLGVSVFLVTEAHFIAILTVVVFAVMLSARVHPVRHLRGGRLLLWTGIGLFLLQALFYHRGDPLLAIGTLVTVTRPGLQRGIVVAGRFVTIVWSSQLFVLTTDPSVLAYALMQAGMPYRYGFALVTALRLVPLFEGESRTVYHAQLVRGVRYDAHALRRVYELVRQFMLPMLVSALRKVDALAISMEGRHFGRYRDRTYIRHSSLTARDRAACVGLALCLLVSLLLRLRM